MWSKPYTSGVMCACYWIWDPASASETAAHMHRHQCTYSKTSIKRAPKYHFFEEIIEKIAQIVRKHQTCGTSLMLSHNLSYFFNYFLKLFDI